MAGSRQQVQYGHDTIAVGALATLSVATAALNIDGNRLQGVRLKQFKYAPSISAKTNTEGPLIIGLSVGLSAAEIAEALLADPQGIMDEPAGERGNRRVFPLFTVGRNQNASGDAGTQINAYRNVRFPWKEIPEGVNMFWFAMNLDTSTLTTGMLVDMNWVAVQE